MENKINKLLIKYGSNVIEHALVQLFIEKNKLIVKKNRLISKVLADKNPALTSAKSSLLSLLDNFDIHSLVNIFELLIPAADKKINGAFFTPYKITEFIAEQTIKSPNQTVCDPSCGCGAFLLAAASLMAKKFNQQVVKTIENNLYGVDLADYSVRRAKIILSLLALSKNEDVEDINFNLKSEDSLVADWGKLFPGIFSRGGFDVIIGNPPYVKFQDLNVNLRKKLYEEWFTLKTGNYNLYFAFFELGVNLMKKDGKLGFITPNNYFTSLAGIHLRKFLHSNQYLDKIIDFNHFKVFKAQTYTCITFISQDKKGYFLYERADAPATLANLEKLSYSKILFTDLDNKKWRLLREKDRINIRNIENQSLRLGKIADIRVGIATCKDSVYFIDGSTLQGNRYFKTYQGKVFPIEKEVTLPIAKISRFRNLEELKTNTARIIFPYRRSNGKASIIPEKEFRSLYPLCYNYFLAAKAELATRDKGMTKYPEWYAYARTQGLNFYGTKLLTPTFSAMPRFMLENNKEALFCNGYAVYLTDGERKISSPGQNGKLSLNLLGKILNSRIMDYYVKLTSVSIEGGFPCYQKNFIELFGIPEFTPEEYVFLENEGDKQKIDAFLTKKYNLSFS